MALAIRKLAPKVVPLRQSSLQVFDIPVEHLIDSQENPQEMDEKTFDQLVEGIKTEGFDEPIHVIPIIGGPNRGKWIIVSGHHRTKAAKLAGFKAIPAIIKEGWNEDKRKIELVRRNHLRGGLNPEKFTRLFNELSKKYDASILKAQMGFTKEEGFKQVYRNIERSLKNPAQKKKLAEAKEKINSVDGISSVLNDIFKQHGSDLDHGFMVFSFAGKHHHYIECDRQLHKMLEKFEAEVKDRGLLAADVFKYLVDKADLSKIRASDKVAERKEQREKQ